MNSVHEAALLSDPEQKILVQDPVPLRSAQMFKFISDAIWQQKDSDEDWAVHALPSVLAPTDALEQLETTIRRENEELALTRTGENRTLTYRDEEVTIPNSDLWIPEACTIETSNWDERLTGRRIILGNDKVAVKFTDGHRDYARELAVHFHYRIAQQLLTLQYIMQRFQYTQNHLTHLSTNLWYSDFAEMGYEGSLGPSATISEEHELEILRTFAQIGSIALDKFEEAA